MTWIRTKNHISIAIHNDRGITTTDKKNMIVQIDEVHMKEAVYVWHGIDDIIHRFTCTHI